MGEPAQRLDSEIPAVRSYTPGSLGVGSQDRRRISFKFAAGVFFLPVPFSLLTLRPGYTRAARIVSLGWLAFILAFGIFNPSKQPTVVKTEQLATDTAQSEQVSLEEPSAEAIPKPYLDIAIAGIKEYPEVVDADVAQDGNQISLVVIVKPRTSVAKGRERGEDFLRMIMSNSNGIENAPKKEIGVTRYNYIISVATPNQKDLALGGKAPGSLSITW